MKTITIHQPWAWAIAQGHKTIENRGWTTNYRGRLLIHAGLSRKSLETGRRYLTGLGIEVPPDDDLVYGALIAIVRLTECRHVLEIAGQPFAEGPYCWMLKDHRAIEPLRMAGSQGLFDVSQKVVDGLTTLDGSRVIGIEPSYPSWTPGTLPLS